MKVYAGIWIDHREAQLVLLRDGKEEILRFQIEEGDGNHSTAGGLVTHEYTRNDFIAEDKLERKAATRRKHLFDEVAGYLHEADEIVVLGPGDAKHEFVKRIMRGALRGHINPGESMERMTDRDIGAYLQERFLSSGACSAGVSEKA